MSQLSYELLAFSLFYRSGGLFVKPTVGALTVRVFLHERKEASAELGILSSTLKSLHFTLNLSISPAVMHYELSSRPSRFSDVQVIIACILQRVFSLSSLFSSNF